MKGSASTENSGTITSTEERATEVSEALPTQRALIAVEEARRSEVQNGIPVGSVLLRGDEVIARGHNRRVQSNDPPLMQKSNASGQRVGAILSRMRPLYQR